MDDTTRPGLVGVEEFIMSSGGIFSGQEGLSGSWLSLPVVSGSAASALDVASGTLEGLSRGGGVRVLVVEDEPFALEALTELLADDGFEVCAASTYAAAMAALHEGVYDVLLSDVVLPDGSGLALGDWASRERPGMRIVLMSGYVPDRSRFGSGWYFLRKPLDVSSLRRLLGGA